MPAQPARREASITEHVRQSLGYHLRTGTVETYDLATGAYAEWKLTDIIPGIIIRPAARTYRGMPTIDLRDNEESKPYVTWTKRADGPLQDPLYGGAHKDVSYWEIDVRLGEQTVFQRDAVEDWLTAFLAAKETKDVYFYHYNSETMSVSRGDVIATMLIQDVVSQDHLDVASARGDDSWLVINFTIRVPKAG